MFLLKLPLKESFIRAQGNCKNVVGEGKIDCAGNFAIASSNMRSYHIQIHDSLLCLLGKR